MTEPTSSNPWYVGEDPWVLTQNEWDPERTIYSETIFTQSNGYLGVRGYTEEQHAGVDSYREAYLAGVFGEVDDVAMQQLAVSYPWPMLCMITLPELFACEIELNRERFALSDGTLSRFRRSLDMRNGVLSREVSWSSPQGHRTRLGFNRFLSSAVPHLAVQQVTIEPENWEGTATCRFLLDATIPSYFRCGDRTFPHLPQALLEDPQFDVADDGSVVLTVRTRSTRHRVSLASSLAGGSSSVSRPGPGQVEQTVTQTVVPGESVTVLHGVAVVSSRDEVEPADIAPLALEIASDATRAGYEATLAESQDVWNVRWEMADIEIDGPARDQAYIRFSAFSMLQMAPFHTDRMSVPARAYALNRYHGLYYWDSETFLMPHYLHTCPEVAENLLSFRYRTLDGARRTAAHLQSPGACFPWMTDSEDGTEQAPWGIGDYLWHQNADIAYAIDQYVRVTGDTDFMVDKGLEIILESARFWMSRLEEDADGVVHLHDTVGPDELDKHGKDNGYSSLLARHHLRLAAQWLERVRELAPNAAKGLMEKLELEPGEPVGWVQAADRLAVPNVPGRNFPLQDEFLLAKEPISFDGLSADEAFAMRHTHRVVKQADIILAMYLLQEEFSLDQMREAYDFYEPMTLHFSSLSYNTHSILATRIGRPEQAYEYFLKAAGLDLDDLRRATRDGLHAAALGGTWQTIVYGFLGMRLDGERLVLEPRLPSTWKSLRLRIHFRGYRLLLTVTPDRQQLLVESSESDLPAEIFFQDEVYALREGLQIATSPGILNTMNEQGDS